MGDRIRILVADDHAVVRRGLRSIIEEDAAFQVVAEAADGEAALGAVRDLLPDVTVLDIDMPKRDGVSVAQEIHRLGLPTGIIFLTLHDDEDLFRRAMELGVKGYLLKDSAMLEIVAALKAVAAGRPYLSSEMSVRLLQAHHPIPEPRPESLLTPSERRILQLIGEGLSSKEIGEVLSIHYRTVENHRTNMCRKLGLEGANSLVRFALQNRSGS